MDKQLKGKIDKINHFGLDFVKFDGLERYGWHYQKNNLFLQFGVFKEKENRPYYIQFKKPGHYNHTVFFGEITALIQSLKKYIMAINHLQE